MPDTLDPQSLQALAGSVLSVVVVVLLGMGIVLGVALWLLGWKLAKPACAVSGIVLGGLGGLALGELLRGEGAFTVPLVIGAGIAGGLLAGLLFRVWMAVSAAALLALAMPAAVVIWQGTPAERETPPEPAAERAPADPRGPGGRPDSRSSRRPAPPPEAATTNDAEPGHLRLQEFAEAVQERLDSQATVRQQDDAPGSASDADRPVANEAAQQQLDAALGEAREAAHTWYSQTREQLAAWWHDLDGGARQGLFIAAGLGAVVGLTLGLAVPYTAAAVQSALVGGLLVLLAGRGLTARAAPGWVDYFPHTPRATLIWLGLITLLGVLLQWTFFHKRTDK